MHTVWLPWKTYAPVSGCSLARHRLHVGAPADFVRLLMP